LTIPKINIKLKINYMKLAVVGSRAITDEALIFNSIHSITEGVLDNLTIISGGARGVDSIAAKWAKQNNVPLIVFNADWNTFGKSAGMIRNNDIIRECDTVLAIWDGKSKGTHHSIKLGKSLNKNVVIVDYSEKQ
jgi:hypothetical protein